MKFTMPNTCLEFERPHPYEAHYWGWQALMGQHLLEIEDRSRTPSAEDAADTRSRAVEEWSTAVRNGFVCC